MSIQEIEFLALRLSAAKRAMLAQYLIAGLANSDEVERARAEEAGRSWDEIGTVAVQTIPADSVLAEVRHSLS